MTVRYTPESLGIAIRTARKRLGITQKDLALTSGTGLRFIFDLEIGKPTCHLGKALTVINTLGLSLKLTYPDGEDISSGGM